MTAGHVGEQAHGQRGGLDQVPENLDRVHHRGNGGAQARWYEALEVMLRALLADPRHMRVEEGHQRERERDRDVRRGRRGKVQLVQARDGCEEVRQQAEQIERENEEELSQEERQELATV